MIRANANYYYETLYNILIRKSSLLRCVLLFNRLVSYYAIDN